MKLKRLPEDFQVEELCSLAPQGGEFALYRLSKRGLGTPEAVAAVARRWNVPRAKIAVGGLKDRHAITRQALTIYRGPRRNLQQTNLELIYLGQAGRAVTSAEITANRFTMVLRDLDEADRRRLPAALQEITAYGLPNYFDQQRFGSLGAAGEFMARAWCAGDHQRALWLALADESQHDRPADRAVKVFLRQQWGQWEACAGRLGGSPGRAALEHLAARPGDFRGAVHRLPAEGRRLYLAAFQSDLWNRLLGELLRQECRREQCFDVSLGRQLLPFYRQLDPPQQAALAAATLPLPSVRTRLPAGPTQALIDRVLQAEGLQLRDLKADNLRDSFFSKGDRAALYFPVDLQHNLAADDLYPGRGKATLRFELPRGCYATILVRRLDSRCDVDAAQK